MPQIQFPNSPPLRVANQSGKDSWVSPVPNELTHFISAQNKFGTPAFLAHNTGAGKYLYNLKVGDPILFRDEVAGQGAGSIRRVKEIRRYQTLEPKNVLSPLIDLATGKSHKAEDITDEIYRDNKRMVFQTCIPKGGNQSWGRMFVIAE
jgi:hypothetical protein